MFKYGLFFLTAVFSTGASASEDCKILSSFEYAKYLGKKAEDVLSLSAKSSEGDVYYDYWIVDKGNPLSASVWKDPNIESIIFSVGNRSVGKGARGRIGMISLVVPAVLNDVNLYSEYFDGCGDADARRGGVELMNGGCLWATSKHNISVEITNEKIEKIVYKNEHEIQCR